MPKAVIRKDQLHSVDWLTEYIRRICQARASDQRLESVSMKSVMRLEKVIAYSLIGILRR